jgi:hypothetical protein
MSPEITTVPVTSLVRPTVSLLRPRAVSRTRKPAGSAGWRTYLALHATFLSIADDELRRQVQAALARSEQEHIARIAQAWEHLTAVLGYRLRPGSGATFQTIAVLLSATMRGLVLMALSMPGIGTSRTPASPFGAPDSEEWSLPALGLGAVASALLEPDPAVQWDDERRASARETLAGLTLPPG